MVFHARLLKHSQIYRGAADELHIAALFDGHKTGTSSSSDDSLGRELNTVATRSG